ncbi:hypothetical protein ACWDBD_49015 [Streptomyces sp. NPDC001118]
MSAEPTADELDEARQVLADHMRFEASSDVAGMVALHRDPLVRPNAGSLAPGVAITAPTMASGDQVGNNIDETLAEPPMWMSPAGLRVMDDLVELFRQAVLNGWGAVYETKRLDAEMGPTRRQVTIPSRAASICARTGSRSSCRTAASSRSRLELACLWVSAGELRRTPAC